MSGRLVMVGEAATRGDSAVAKSFVPGKGYLPATKVGAKGLRDAAADRAKAAELEALLKPGRKAKGRKIYTGYSLTGPGKTGTVRRYPESHPANRGGGLALPDGRGGGVVFADSGQTFRHEMAHISPRRNVIRFRERTGSDPRRQGREEGRAEFLANGKAAPTYPDYSQRDPRWRAGYDEVQGKMTRGRVRKVDTTMSERQAARIARQYGTKGPLPKGLDRDTKMKAYEGRYIASGGKKGEMWGRRADRAEVGRNVGLASATVAAGGLLAARGRRTGPALARNRVTRHATPHRLETAALGSALGGGWSELYGEHARSRRASYQNTPAGVAGSALTRMRAYTPDRRTT